MNKTINLCGNLYFEFIKCSSTQSKGDDEIEKREDSELFKKLYLMEIKE
ncbi:MAG: hypothetical protein ACFE9T_02045 [Promethearchaeota archaeon]